MKHVVKRHGHFEIYDGKKVYASAFASALNAHLSDEDAEHLAMEVLIDVDNWVKDKESVSAHQIRHEIEKSLKKHNKEVAMLYKHHMDIC